MERIRDQSVIWQRREAVAAYWQESPNIPRYPYDMEAWAPHDSSCPFGNGWKIAGLSCVQHLQLGMPESRYENSRADEGYGNRFRVASSTDFSGDAFRISYDKQNRVAASFY